MALLNNADAIHFGDRHVDRVYLGAQRVWPSWLPADLFADGSQGAWFAPNIRSSMFADVAGTQPIMPDQPVGLLMDLSGNGNHARQEQESSRPVYRTNGARHWLEFDGVDDFLISDTIDVGGTDTTTVAAAAQLHAEVPAPFSYCRVASFVDHQGPGTSIPGSWGLGYGNNGTRGQFQAAGSAYHGRTLLLDDANAPIVLSGGFDLPVPRLMVGVNGNLSPGANNIAGGEAVNLPLRIGAQGSGFHFPGAFYGMIYVAGAYDEGDGDILIPSVRFLAHAAGIGLDP